MKNNLFLLVALVSMIIVSCSAPVQKETQQTNPQQLNQMQIMKLKQDESALSRTNAPAVTAPAQSSTPVRLNPPHGQPGHICEIPVGSPLPSTPVRSAVNTNSSVASSPAINQNNTATPTATNTVRLNPPHGQPGHICEIPVGSPLP
jgi:hypothetical protein